MGVFTNIHLAFTSGARFVFIAAVACCMLLLASAQVRLECSVRLKDAHFIFFTSSHCDVGVAKL